MSVKTEGTVRERTTTGEELTHADRVAQGKDARVLAPLESHEEFTPDKSRDPVGLLLEQGKPRAGAGADPERTDARVVVHVLPGRGAADGG